LGHIVDGKGFRPVIKQSWIEQQVLDVSGVRSFAAQSNYVRSYVQGYAGFMIPFYACRSKEMIRLAGDRLAKGKERVILELKSGQLKHLDQGENPPVIVLHQNDEIYSAVLLNVRDESVEVVANWSEVHKHHSRCDAERELQALVDVIRHFEYLVAGRMI
jgi:hypothetical protein